MSEFVPTWAAFPTKQQLVTLGLEEFLLIHPFFETKEIWQKNHAAVDLFKHLVKVHLNGE
jgi:hypothetical protein